MGIKIQIAVPISTFKLFSSGLMNGAKLVGHSVAQKLITF